MMVRSPALWLVTVVPITAAASSLASAPAGSTAPQLLIWEGTSTDMGAMTAVGLLNRPAASSPQATKPFFSAAYASFGWANHHSREWLEEAVASDPKLVGVRMTNTTNATLVIEHALTSGAAQGLVLYNSSEGEDLLPTVLTLCSVYDAVALDCQRVPCTGAASAGEVSWQIGPVLFDARNRWSNNLTAGTWAADNLLQRTASDDLMAVTAPNVVASGYLVDVIISRKLFVMANQVCTPFSPASKLFDRVAESEHWERKHLLSIMGYNGAEEVLNLCTLRHDVISLVSDFVVNLSFLSLMTKFHEMPHAPLPPVATPAFNSSKVYVALIRSDGDNLQIVTGGQRDQMSARRKQCAAATDANRSFACPPQTWTLSNRLLEFGPSVLRWWYAQAAAIGRDDFIFGPSGYGYIWPSLIDPPAKQQQFADDTPNASSELAWPGYIHWDYATIDGDAIKRYIGRLNSSTVGRVQPARGGRSRPAIQGAFINFPTSLSIEEDRVGDVELFRCHQALDLPPANVTKALNELPLGSTSFLYQVREPTFCHFYFYFCHFYFYFYFCYFYFCRAWYEINVGLHAHAGMDSELEPREVDDRSGGACGVCGLQRSHRVTKS